MEDEGYVIDVFIRGEEDREPIMTLSAVEILAERRNGGSKFHRDIHDDVMGRRKADALVSTEVDIDGMAKQLGVGPEALRRSLERLMP